MGSERVHDGLTARSGFPKAKRLLNVGRDGDHELSMIIIEVRKLRDERCGKQFKTSGIGGKEEQNRKKFDSR